MLSQLIVFLILSIKLITAFDPVAFTAIKGGRYDNYVTLSTMVVNNKADFNPMFGAFKCTSPGIYFFSFNALSQPDKELRLSLRVSKIPVITAYGRGPNPVSVSGSTLLQLAENDLVYLFIEKGEINESTQIDQAYTSFSGFQISEKKSAGFFSGIIGGRSAQLIPRLGHTQPAILPSSTESSFTVDENDNIFELIEAYGSP